jgi:acyl-CoA thioester hydrolase
MNVETKFRVRYAETDQMGVVYHGNYVVWMEVGRVEYCRTIGIRYRDMEEQDGVLLAVAKVNCRFVAPARYDDEVSVTTRVARAHSRLVEFAYVIRRVEDGQLLAEGETTHVFCDRELQPRKLPPKYWEAFGIRSVAQPQNAV